MIGYRHLKVCRSFDASDALKSEVMLYIVLVLMFSFRRFNFHELVSCFRYSAMSPSQHLLHSSVLRTSSIARLYALLPVP